MDVRVELRKGGMEAVALLGPDAGDHGQAAASILESLIRLGVKNPPDVSAIVRVLEASGGSSEVVVARGTPPQQGISATLLPAFPIKDTPIMEGVDPLDAYFRNVTYPGEVILRKSTPSEGIHGETLLGNFIPAQNGTDLVVTPTGGVLEDASGQVFTSGTYGVVLFNKGRLGVAEAVKMGNDRMEAFVTVLPDKSRDEAAQIEKIVSSLRELNIVRGLDLEAIQRAVREAAATGAPVHNVVAARGQPAVDGHEAEYKVVIDLERKAFKALEGDRVDYKETDTVKNVNKGDVIAEVLQAAKPEPGYRVDGSAINPRTTHVSGLKPGVGVVLSEDGKSIVAEIDGMIVVKGGKFNVVGEYNVQGDVDIKTGNIHAAGFVRINGNVTSGFLVQSGRDLAVGGDVWEAVIESGGNVKIQGAITAGSRVTAKGNVSARFVQNSFVETQGNLDVSLNITASEVYVKGHVKVLGSQGLIVGGVVNATMGVEARTIGSPTARTSVAVGLDLRVMREIEAIKKSIPHAQEELQRLHSSLGKEFLKDPKAALLALPPTLRKNKLDVLKAMKDLQEKMTGDAKRLEELTATAQEQKDAVIMVHGEIFAGTEVTVGKVKSTISETIHRVSIHYDPEHHCVAWRRL